MKIKPFVTNWEKDYLGRPSLAFIADLLPDDHALIDETFLDDMSLTELIFDHPGVCVTHDECKGLNVPLSKRTLKILKIAEKCHNEYGANNVMSWNLLSGLTIIKMHVDSRGFMYRGTRLERFGTMYHVDADVCKALYLEMWNSNVFPVRIRGRFRASSLPKWWPSSQSPNKSSAVPPKPSPLADIDLSVDEAWELFGIAQKRGSQEDVKKRYHAFVTLYHPDKNQHRVDWATAQLVRANAAWALLQKHCGW
jgi:hypothetical protein